MFENRQVNDQSIIRAIRKAIGKFNSLPEEDINGRLRVVMAVASLGAVGLVANKQMVASTVSYIESTLAR